MSTLEHWLRLAERGYHLVPVTIRRRPDGRKRPEFHEGWSAAPTTDPEVIRDWTVQHPGCSFAIACGPSGIDVVDLDPKDGGPASWAELGMPASTDAVATPSGGWHFYWRQHPGGSIGTGAGGLGRGVDTRGDRGVVFAPGSVVIGLDGQPEAAAYVGDLPKVSDLAQLPEVIRNAAGARRPERERSGESTGHHLEWVTAAVAEQRARVRAFDPRTMSGFRELLMGAALVAGRAADAGCWPADALADALAQDAASVWGAADDDDREWIRRGMDEGPALERWTIQATPGSNTLWTPGEGELTDLGNTPAAPLAGAVSVLEVPAPASPLDTMVERIRLQRHARRIVDAEERPADPGPTGRRLAAFLAEPDEGEAWRVDRLWPQGGKVLLAAPAKAGKTTTVMNLVRALADAGTGARFLDKPTPGHPGAPGGLGNTPEWKVAAAGFAVAPLDPGRRVALLDFEMTPRGLRRWLRGMGIQAPDGLVVELMRGRTWDVRDPAVRGQWAAWLRSEAVQVLVVDPIGPVLHGLGIDENDNSAVGGLLVALDALCREAGVDELLVVHHAGHGGDQGHERARGASSFMGWPDALWTLGRDKITNTRGFRADGRDVFLPDTVLEHDQDTHRLWLGQGSRAQVAGNADAEVVAALVGQECAGRAPGAPGPSGRELERALKDASLEATGKTWGTDRREDAVKAARNLGLVHTHPGSMYPGQQPNAGLHFPGASCGQCPGAPGDGS